jgi:hypothetical protein
MSHVDNCLLSFSGLEDEKARAAEVNAFLAARDDRQQFVSIDEWQGYGGYKMLETPLYVCAFNHLDEGWLMEQLSNVAWEHPADVQLLIKRQDDDRFEIVQLPGRATIAVRSTESRAPGLTD